MKIFELFCVFGYGISSRFSFPPENNEPVGEVSEREKRWCFLGIARRRMILDTNENQEKREKQYLSTNFLLLFIFL